MNKSEREKKVALVIPIHPPKKSFIKELLYTYINNSDYVDIFFVISNENDFNQMCDIDFMDTALVFLPPGINEKITRHAHAIFKKLYGLDYVAKLGRYDYALAIDSEIDLLELSDIHPICASICSIRAVYGCQSDWEFARKINKRCRDFLIKNLIECSGIDQSIYFWWSQLPVYDLKIVEEFLKDIGFHNFDRTLPLLSWWCFENILYLYYCVAFHDYKLIKLDQFNIKLNNSLENKMTGEVIDRLEENNILIHWQNATLPRRPYHKFIYHKDHNGGQHNYNRLTNDGLAISPLSQKNSFIVNNQFNLDLFNRNAFKNHRPFLSEGDFCLKQKIVFVAWLSEGPVPAQLVDNFLQIRDICHDCNILLISPFNLDGFFLSAAPIHHGFWRMPLSIRTELFKAYLLHHFGGCYIDATAPLERSLSRSMQTLLGTKEAMLSISFGSHREASLQRLRDPAHGSVALNSSDTNGVPVTIVLAKQKTAFTKFWSTEQARCLDDFDDELTFGENRAVLEQNLQRCFASGIEQFHSSDHFLCH